MNCLSKLGNTDCFIGLTLKNNRKQHYDESSEILRQERYQAREHRDTEMRKRQGQGELWMETRCHCYLTRSCSCEKVKPAYVGICGTGIIPNW